ncbi:MAG TPA: TAXI family TRAP transporter solute-binding subunit [Trueperaceae bacterium]|nr:TAXI family TRAP transporter solute-binding subunit [Trueperaceae bacterium]
MAMIRAHRLGGRALLALGLAATIAAPAAAQPKLPDTLSWSAYDVGSGGYNQAVAIGNALKQKYGVNLRVLPGKNDVSRTLPLREGKVQFSANGVGGTYLSQEGVYEFGAKNWGPQPVRALMLNTSDQLLTVLAAGDVGIKTVADLKGKRVAWVIGAPSLNQNITAILAHANLTWDDVKKVEFGGFGAAMDGIVNNQVDAAFSSSISGKAYAIAKSPRGLVYPIISHADKEGWKRMNAIAPFFFPFMGTEGADLSKEKPAEAATYPSRS